MQEQNSVLSIVSLLCNGLWTHTNRSDRAYLPSQSLLTVTGPTIFLDFGPFLLHGNENVICLVLLMVANEGRHLFFTIQH